MRSSSTLWCFRLWPCTVRPQRKILGKSTFSNLEEASRLFVSLCICVPCPLLPPLSQTSPEGLLGKINIFRHYSPELLSLFFFFPFFINPNHGKHIFTSPFLTALSVALPMASYCHPSEKSCPRGAGRHSNYLHQSNPSKGPSELHVEAPSFPS